jgi:hypothetical protein
MKIDFNERFKDLNIPSCFFKNIQELLHDIPYKIEDITFNFDDEEDENYAYLKKYTVIIKISSALGPLKVTIEHYPNGGIKCYDMTCKGSFCDGNVRIKIENTYYVEPFFDGTHETLIGSINYYDKEGNVSLIKLESTRNKKITKKFNKKSLIEYRQNSLFCIYSDFLEEYELKKRNIQPDEVEETDLDNGFEYLNDLILTCSDELENDEGFGL